MNTSEEYDILIIGAGPSGCVAAGYLQQQGARILVVEKSKFPRIVVGESLIPRVMDHFDEAGLFPALDKMGFEKKWGARFLRGEEVCIFDFSQKFGEGWDWTWQVPRADFDNTMAQEVINKGIDLEFETEVIGIEFNGSDSITTVKTKDGETKEIHAKFLIDSSGYGRVLPRLLDLERPSKPSPHSAIFSHVDDINREEGQEGTLISFDIIETEVWLWVIPFSNGKTSLGIVGPTEYIEKLSENGDTTEALRKAISLSDYYVKRFGDVEFLFEPRHLKDYSCAVKKLYGDGFALTGNSSEFLDPVFSSGVMFAAESGSLAAKLAVRELNGEVVDWHKDYEVYIQKAVETFKTYVASWYDGALQDVFFADNPNPKIKRQLSSILAGYVWDTKNPWVRNHTKLVYNVADLIKKNGNSLETIQL